ncbi:putative mitochondrial mitochondrial RNA binding protein 2 [Leptomonas pyrrhocoris]|uniref:Putative mitochondrial mitochondrial RNA binding protein 2 n=1 Tax=Leptomonas pyrrhocoris TaxID=157538 RepID=A0A0M9FWX3_LEPPY|nr:putative mitochondrial mitochondrial RNA binding protein 2 [Leptomonas pyrrhocoris]XP_015656093.1 putative mitochondrial mitochondrial RNA binding protein 2 [Leptomonas pyrrhocoris]KPA77653.1 putative mitochondrial mitochondrial RNA binding protein 2 [Leptomonas pyrrhocoris]KPA77654.1 putative mitochondrial mitochondrial RNA binding protein 2 [Leptomonas pyrrhocoris]|eukprot:XP_015656092.1 putative mitochondrial mitochondrial RNA binding protein 2 [Leptomonas pyrrhocoris]
MLRRVATVCAVRSRLSLVTAASASPAAASLRFTSARWAATDAAANVRNSNNNNNNNNNGYRQRSRRPDLPPAFDIVHWNDEDVSRGHLLRVLHRNGYIALDYHRQKHTAAPAGDAPARRENRAEKVVTVTLPPVYVARFLGVLEGRMDKVDVQSRFTNATFAPNAAKGRHHYTLHCTSMRPTTGQMQTADGADVQEETVEWTVELDAAESLMLHRFLTQALHHNSGFGRDA